MKFSVLTLFPEMMNALGESIIGRAVKKGIIETEYINIRDFTNDKHRRTDDYPYGAGGGMVMQPPADLRRLQECFGGFAAMLSICRRREKPSHRKERASFPGTLT